MPLWEHTECTLWLLYPELPGPGKGMLGRMPEQQPLLGGWALSTIPAKHSSLVRTVCCCHPAAAANGHIRLEIEIPRWAPESSPRPRLPLIWGTHLCALLLGPLSAGQGAGGSQGLLSRGVPGRPCWGALGDHPCGPGLWLALRLQGLLSVSSCLASPCKGI